MVLEKTCAFLLAAAICCSAVPVELDSLHKLQWQEWKSLHGKTYSQEREDSERSLVWADNKKFIDTHNTLGEGSYTLALNQFGDMVCSSLQNHCCTREVS